MLKHQSYLLFGIAVSIVFGFGLVLFEMVVDGESVTFFELIFDSIEKSLILVGAGGVFILLRQLRLQHREQLSLMRELEVARLDGADWRSKAKTYLAGLGKEIEQQFITWQFTEAEAEVGLLLLKGLSHKEIAQLRGTAETTIRQQARSIYQKSGLPSKTAFSAYFLEDLLFPRDEHALQNPKHAGDTSRLPQAEELMS